MECAVKVNVASMVDQYMNKNKMKVTEFSKKVGLSHSTISQYLSGKYSSNPDNIEKAIMEFLSQESPEEIQLTEFTEQRPKFMRTKDSGEILAICQSCQEYSELGLIIGKSGFGKTHTLKFYAKADRVCYIEGRDNMSYNNFIKSIEKGLGLPKTSGNADDRIDTIKDFLAINRGYLIIVDEADKLANKDTQSKLELLRNLYDHEIDEEKVVGIVIAGEPKLESLLKLYMPRFANRVDLNSKLHGLDEGEVRNYLSNYRFTEDAMKEIVHRSNNQHTGCFRLLDRTMKNVDRIKQAGDPVTLEIMKKASKMMML